MMAEQSQETPLQSPRQWWSIGLRFEWEDEFELFKTYARHPAEAKKELWKILAYPRDREWNKSDVVWTTPIPLHNYENEHE